MLAAMLLTLAPPAPPSKAPADPDVLCMQVSAFVAMRIANGAAPRMSVERRGRIDRESGYFNGIVAERYPDDRGLAAVIAATTADANRADALAGHLEMCGSRHAGAMQRIADAFRSTD